MQKSIADEMRALQHELAQIEVRVTSREADVIDRLRTDLDVVRGELAAAKHAAEARESEVASLRAQLLDRDEALREMQIAVASKDRVIDAIEAGCNEMRAEFVKVTSAHADEQQALRDELKCRDEKLAVLVAQIDNFRQYVDNRPLDNPSRPLRLEPESTQRNRTAAWLDTAGCEDALPDLRADAADRTVDSDARQGASRAQQPQDHDAFSQLDELWMQLDKINRHRTRAGSASGATSSNKDRSKTRQWGRGASTAPRIVRPLGTIPLAFAQTAAMISAKSRVPRVPRPAWQS
jgi:chromosome segregation ATPase